jgi:CRP-like cAMP-binding protein
MSESRRSALARIPLFSGLDPEDLDAVAQIAREEEVPTGSVLIPEGEAGRQFFVLLHGQAEVRRNGQRLNTLGHGDFFGEISLLSDRPTTASVVASSTARVLVIAPRDFRQLLENLPLMQMKIVRALADRLPDEFYYS